MLFLGKELGKNKYPFIVAEISCNHGGDLQQAKALIQAAKDVGADAVKIQVYTADEMTHERIKGEEIHIQEGLWKDRHLYSLYYKTQTDYELAQGMMIYAKKINIPLFASVFSKKSLGWLEIEECPAYKIASFEITDTNLIRQVAKTGKQVVISTGLASLDDIDQAANCVPPDNLILLHCVSAYPTRLETANLWKIPYLEKLYGSCIGFSDHTRGIIAGPLACAMGAIIIEKHLTLPGSDTEDKAFSLHPDEFEKYVIHCRVAASATFNVDVSEEKNSQQFRRSIYTVKDVKKGDLLTKDNIKCIRPSYGLSAQRYSKLIRGLDTFKQDIKAGTALKEEHL